MTYTQYVELAAPQQTMCFHSTSKHGLYVVVEMSIYGYWRYEPFIRNSMSARCATTTSAHLAPQTLAEKEPAVLKGIGIAFPAESPEENNKDENVRALL